MSAKTNVIAIAGPSDPVALLHSDRDRIVADLVEIERKLSRLKEAEREEEIVFKEISALGEREIAAVRAYVSGDMTGPRPEPDAKARRALTERMARAVDASKMAKAVADEVEAQAAPLRKRLAQIDGEIRALKIAEFESRFSDVCAEFAALAEKMHRSLLQIRALPVAMATVGRQALDKGDEAYARGAFSAAGKMRDHRLPEVEPDELAVLRTAAALTNTIISGAEVRLDAPIDPTPGLSAAALMAKVSAANQATNRLIAPDGML